jgi:flagellin
MSFSINTNVTSLQAQNYLQKSSMFQSQTINEVTSGLRIVNSGDDAAGLAIANGFRSDEAVLNQGIQNANNGLATLQTVDGGMNNISTLLDRARTLATESASGTFSGNRETLNQEFQSVITEVTRQATAIGMNQGGQFAQALSVFIGGGKGATSTAAANNGTINLDLSKSAVDAQSLGLQGVQAKGATGTDIGTGSAATSVSTILANAANTASQGTAGYTAFSFSGPGFADGSKVSVSVNLGGVTDATTLASAINAAIATSGNGATQAATAFKNANITASVVTDSTGKQQLAFSSSTSAFQVQAGDTTANALLGNFARNATSTGTDNSATADTSSVVLANRQLSFKFDGSSTAVTVQIAQGSAADSKADIVNQLNADSNFKLAGKASLQGNQIVIQSLNNSSSSAVQVTSSGNLTAALGLSGTASAAAASTGAALNTTVTGAGAVSNNAAIVGAVLGSTVISTSGSATNAVLTSPNPATDANIAALNSGAGVGTVGTAGVLTGSAANHDTALAALNGSSGTAAADTLKLKVDGSASAITVNIATGTTSLSSIVSQINTQQGTAVTASITGAAGTQQLVLTSKTTGAASNVVVDSTTTTELFAALGVTSNQTGVAGNAPTNDALVLNVDGVNHSVTINAGDKTLNSIKTDINTAAIGVTASITGSGANQKLVLTSTGTPGSSDNVTVVSAGTTAELLGNTLGFTGGESASGSAAGSANTNLNVTVGSGPAAAVTLATGTYTASQMVAQLNTQFKAGSVGATAGLDTAGHLVITATQPGQSLTLNSTATNAYAALGLTAGTSSTTSLFTSNDNIKVQISGAGMTSPVTLALNQTTAGSTKVSDVIANLVSQVTGNNQLSAAGISVTTNSDGNNLVFTNNKGEQFDVAVTGDTNNKLGLGSFATNASSGNAFDYSSITGGVVATNPQTAVTASGSLNISLNGAATASPISVALKSTSGTITGTSVTDAAVAAASLAGTDKVNVLVNGVQQSLTLAASDTTLAKVRDTINTQTGASGVTADIVTDNSGNQSLRLTAAGTASSVTVEGTVAGTTAAALTATGLTAGQSNTGLASASAVVDDAVSQINAAVAGNSSLSAAGLKAVNNSGTIQLESTNGTNFRVSGSGSTDLGFGIGGGSYSGTIVSAAPTVGRADSQGAYASSSMNFSALANGGDSQTVSITANDSNGGAHSLAVNLQNSSTSINGKDIDSAIHAINTALQQSNDSTLQSVYAVKEDNADGTQAVKFMSTTQNFKIAVSSTSDGSGIAAPTGGVSTAAQNGTGANANIDTIAGAESAVNALATAVQNLGTAQAAVGKGENNLNYAVALAQSQSTNEAAAESQIRDANLAQEAANLTKAQILVQAGTAALAQANSAPQQLLSLLK